MLIDLSEVKESQPQNLPDGQYACVVTKAEVKDTKTPGGQYIKAEITIKAGRFEGRKVWALFNIKNNNPQAAEIGLQQLKSLLVAAAHPNPNALGSVSELEGLQVGIKTKTKTDAYGEKTEVSYFMPVGKVAADVAPHKEDPLPF